MANNEFKVGFKLNLLHKDLKICQSTVAEMGASLPLVDDSITDYAQLMEMAHGEEDISALIRLKRALFTPPGDKSNE